MVLTIGLPDSTSWVFLALGGVFCVVGARSLTKSERLSEKGASGRAEVTQLIWQSDGDMGGAYYPEFRFTAIDGNEYSVVSDFGTAPAPFRVGQSIRVLYDPDNPHAAVIDTVFQMWLWPGVSGGAGLVILGVGIGRYVAHFFPL